MNQSSPSPSIECSDRTAGALLDGLADNAAISGLQYTKPFTDISLDSRTVSRDGLFVAMAGHSGDGRNFADQAIADGAAAIVYDGDKAPESCKALSRHGRAVAVDGLRSRVSQIAARFFGEPSNRLAVTGVTGTNGKTTCVYLLAQALERLGREAAIMGTIGSGAVDRLEPVTLTTVDAVAVQRTLAQLSDQGFGAVCMEVSSHGLDQGRVNAVAFDIALFTNLTQDHLDYHGDMQKYAEAKCSLFRSPGLDAMVVNADDRLGQWLLAEYSNKPGAPRVISYGITGGELRAEDVEFHNRGIRFVAHFQGQRVNVDSMLIGGINLPNLLGVTGCLLASGHELNEIAGIMPALVPPPGRMEVFGTADLGPMAVVDYSHTPDSLERALQSLRQHVEGDLWLVFGCGGDRDRGKRPQMGRVAAMLADHIIVTNDNPRSEPPQSIADEVVAGIEQELDTQSRDVNWQRNLDRGEAIRQALGQARRGDLVLVAGKGHERTQTIGDRVLPFSDRELVAELIGVAS